MLSSSEQSFSVFFAFNERNMDDTSTADVIDSKSNQNCDGWDISSAVVAGSI
jgi:hypothetical protein